MAFTFDATVGGNTANSFVSVSYADDYFTAHLENSFWNIPSAQKQAALVMATHRLTNETFGGERSTKTQALCFPRNYIAAIDVPSTAYISNTTIPEQLNQATCEMALHYLKQVNGEFSVDDRDLETLTSYKLGPMDFGIRNGFKADSLPQKVKNLLSAIGVNGWSENKASNILLSR